MQPWNPERAVQLGAGISAAEAARQFAWYQYQQWQNSGGPRTVPSGTPMPTPPAKRAKAIKDSGKGQKRGRDEGQQTLNFGPPPGPIANFSPYELKFHDISGGVTDPSTKWTVYKDSLFGIPLNDGPSARSGRLICVHSIHWRGRIRWSEGDLTTLNEWRSIRAMMVQDKQCNGTVVTDANYDNDNIGVVARPTASATLQFYNLFNSRRYHILDDQRMASDVKATYVNSNPNPEAVAYMEYFQNVDWHGNMPVEYDASATTGALTTLRTNNVFLALGTDNTTNSPYQLAWNARVRYIEC